jgi:hypothetical protein
VAGFSFEDIGDGFKKPAPPKPIFKADVNTSKPGNPVSAKQTEIES